MYLPVGNLSETVLTCQSIILSKNILITLMVSFPTSRIVESIETFDSKGLWSKTERPKNLMANYLKSIYIEFNFSAFVI